MTINLSHLASTSGRHRPPWEIPCPALTGIAQLALVDLSSTEAKARLHLPARPCPPGPAPLFRMPTVTKLRCVVRTRRTAHASTGTNVNLPTAIRNCAQFPGIQNTRQICVAPITVSASVPMVQDVTLSTPWTRSVTPPPSLRTRRHKDPLNNCQCLEETEEILGISTPTTRTRQRCDLLWHSWTNTSTCPVTVHF